MHNYLIGDSEYLIFNLYSYLCSAMKNLVIIITFLVSLCCCTIEADRNRMWSGHDSINQRKRNDQPFGSFPRRERIVPPQGTKRSHAGNTP